MAKNYKKEYEKYREKIVKENLKDVEKSLDSPEMNYKMERFIKDNPGTTKEEIVDAIKEGNKFAIRMFAKNEKKQNISENFTNKSLVDILEGYDVVKLPSSGPDCVHVENGILLKGDSNKNYQTKSIDFKAENGDQTIYFADKRIEGQGGGQDNQYKDVVNFIKNARDNNDENTMFVAICNGDYFEKDDPKNKGKTRMQTLNDFGKEGKVEAHDLDSFNKKFKN